MQPSKAYIIRVDGLEDSEKKSADCAESCDKVGQDWEYWEAYNGVGGEIEAPAHHNAIMEGPGSETKNFYRRMHTNTHTRGHTRAHTHTHMHARAHTHMKHADARRRPRITPHFHSQVRLKRT